MKEPNSERSGFVAIIDPKTWEIAQMIRNGDPEGFTHSNVVQVGNRLYAGTLVSNSVAGTSYPDQDTSVPRTSREQRVYKRTRRRG